LQAELAAPPPLQLQDRVQSDRNVPQWLEERDHAFTEKQNTHVEGRVLGRHHRSE
jgi:hypothetical protein